MKKTVKSVWDFLSANAELLESHSEKAWGEYQEKSPKIALLSCPYPLRYMGNVGTSIYAVTSYGGTLAGNEFTLDYAVKTMEIPVLVLMGHEDCSAVKGALKANAETKGEADLYAAIAPAFVEGKARKVRDNILKHIDYQISLLLERYRPLVKGEKLLVLGVFCDLMGSFHITNYNGLRGVENLAQALPDLEAKFFIG